MENPQFAQIRYDRPGVGVARITLARADIANAQDRAMLYEINTALDFAMHDDEVNVVIMAGDGKHYSSGHHLTDQSKIGAHGAPVMGVGGYELPGAEGYMAQELEIYLGFCWRWRNLPKPTIAQVQGKVIAGGLMLVWPFDLVVAAEDTEFSDPVVAFGVNGHEFFVHAWELGHRKAKELLFTGDSIGAAEAKTLGMVNQVVKREDLESYTLAMAEKIAKRPSMGLKLAKMSVNQSLDAQGMWTAVQSAFALHHLGHTNSLVKHGIRVEPTGVRMIRDGARSAKAAAE